MIAMPNMHECIAEHRLLIPEWITRYGQQLAIDWRNVRACPVDVCRNIIVNQFLDTDCQWLLMMDSDVLPKPTILDVVAIAAEADLPMIGFPTPIYQSNRRMVEWNFGYINSTEVDEYGLPLTRIFNRADWFDPKINHVKINMEDGSHRAPIVQIDRIGTGCVLIRRDVLEAIKQPCFEFLKRADGSTRQGEDYNFCDKVRAAGFTIWADLGNICEHYKGGVPLSPLVRY